MEKRALEVWGSEEELEKQAELREEKRVLSKTKKYNKNMKGRANVSWDKYIWFNLINFMSFVELFF